MHILLFFLETNIDILIPQMNYESTRSLICVDPSFSFLIHRLIVELATILKLALLPIFSLFITIFVTSFLEISGYYTLLIPYPLVYKTDKYFNWKRRTERQYRDLPNL